MSTGITYKLDGVDLATYGIHVSASRGVLDLPSLKQPQKYDWADYHGEIVDLEKPRYGTRSIILDAWVETFGSNSDGGAMIEFAERIKSFYDAVTKPGLHQLLAFISPDKPLVFMVYMKDGMSVDRKWFDMHTYGTFQIKLEEPEPVKRVIKYTGDEASIEFSSGDVFNIYWGDGKSDLDVSEKGAMPVTHQYDVSSTYYICFSGNTDSLISFTTNGEVIWQ